MEIVENVVQLMRRLEALPAAQALLRKDQEAMLTERRRLASERATIAAALEKRLPALLKTRDEATAAASRAHAAWRKAANEAYEAESALMSAGHVAEMSCSKIDCALRATTPPSIGHFLAWLDEAVDAVRREPPIVTVDAVLNYGDLPVPIASNFAAIGRWISRAVEVRRKAEDLALEALDEAQLEERFTALRLELGSVPGMHEAEVRDPALAGVLQRRLAHMAKQAGLADLGSL